VTSVRRSHALGIQPSFEPTLTNPTHEGLGLTQVEADWFEAGAARPVAKIARSEPAVVTPNAFISFGPQFETALDEATGSQVKSGNSIEPLFDGVDSFAARKQLIENAKQTIHLQTFIFSDDDTGRETAKLLCDAARRGVRVRVIYDALGTGRSGAALFDMMRAAGCEVRAYGELSKQPWTLNSRWHQKLLMVDSEQAIAGGMNIANEYAFGGSSKLVRSRGPQAEAPWRDTDVLISGPVLRDFELEFASNWSLVGPSLLETEIDAILSRVSLPRPNGSDVRFVGNNPSAGNNYVEDTLWYAITSAVRSITIETAYFAPTPAIRAALIDARARGVDVRILTNSPTTNDLPLSQTVARYFYRDLLEAGVAIYEKRGGTLHSKTFAFDGRYSIVGSANLNHRASRHDTEAVACMRNSAMARLLELRFESGLQEADGVTLAQLDAQSAFARATQWAAATLLGTFF
jgi:cardiolipin synthase